MSSVLYCNFKKQNKENKSILDRNLPNPELTIIPDYRSEYMICRKYKNMNQIPKSDRVFQSIQQPHLNGLYPGKSSAKGYFENIDVDSDLKNLNIDNTLCPTKKYHMNKDINEFNNQHHPSYWNFHTDNEYTPYNTYKTDCNWQKQEVKEFSCQNKNSVEPTQSIIQFNYKNNNSNEDCLGVSGCLPKNPNHVYVKQPLPYQYKTDMMQATPGSISSPTLPMNIGPERSNHTLENIWNNVSKRRYITKNNMNKMKTYNNIN